MPGTGASVEQRFTATTRPPGTDARKLARSLISWHIWCEENLPNERRTRFKLQKPIEAALKSSNLASAAGYRVDSGIRKADDWLLVWGRTVGKEEIEQMLQEQNLPIVLLIQLIQSIQGSG